MSIFLQKKMLPNRQLRRNKSEETLVSSFMELLRPTTRQGIRAASIRTYHDLATFANHSEVDEIKLQKNTVRKSENRTEPKLVDKQVDGEDAPPKCWYSPGRHLNRDYPEKNKAFEQSFQPVPSSNLPEKKEKNPIPENWRRPGSPAERNNPQ